MKKMCITLILIFIISLTVAVNVNTKTKNEEYLRIHIRANSNEIIDQNIKYQVKDAMVNILTPYIAECNTKEDALNLLYKKEEYLDESSEDIVSSFVKQYYYNLAYFPKNIILENKLIEKENIEKYLSSLRGNNVDIIVP